MKVRIWTRIGLRPRRKVVLKIAAESYLGWDSELDHVASLHMLHFTTLLEKYGSHSLSFNFLEYEIK